MMHRPSYSWQCAFARAMDVHIGAVAPLSLQVNDNLPIKCEVCQVKCANSNMYADHLKGKRHRCVWCVTHVLGSGTRGACLVP